MCALMRRHMQRQGQTIHLSVLSWSPHTFPEDCCSHLPPTGYILQMLLSSAEKAGGQDPQGSKDRGSGLHHVVRQSLWQAQDVSGGPTLFLPRFGA